MSKAEFRWIDLSLLSVILVLKLILPAWPADLHSGDLIFLDLDCGEICDAIEDVTLEQFHVSAPRLSHVGVLSFDRDSREWWVFEAWPQRGVSRISLDRFLKRVKSGEDQKDGYYLVRFPASLRSQAIEALKRIRRYFGKPYDSAFVVNDSDFYCSELVYQSWQGQGMNPFSLLPMYFGAPESPQGRIWKEYFADLKISIIPEFLPGISPLGIYLQAQAVLN